MRDATLRLLALCALVLTGCPDSTPVDGSTTNGTSGGDTPGSTTTTSGGTSSAGETTEDPAPSESAGALPPGSGCCAPHQGPGCNEADVQSCVCEMDTSCCGFDWSEGCAELAQARCDATCQPDMPSSEGSTGGRTSGVTTSGLGTTGFAETGFAETGFGTTGFGSTGDFGDALCCYEGFGCNHIPTEQCVCDIDSSCCDGEWTEACVAIATDSCNACTSDDCCTPQTDAGCSDTTVQDCVCDIDPYCCDTEWDYICIEVAEFDCKACAG